LTQRGFFHSLFFGVIINTVTFEGSFSNRIKEQQHQSIYHFAMFSMSESLGRLLG